MNNLQNGDWLAPEDAISMEFVRFTFVFVEGKRLGSQPSKVLGEKDEKVATREDGGLNIDAWPNSTRWDKRVT